MGTSTYESSAKHGAAMFSNCHDLELGFAMMTQQKAYGATWQRQLRDHDGCQFENMAAP